MNLPLYDAHNHLQDERLGPWLEEITRLLPSLGIREVVVNGSCGRTGPAWPISHSGLPG